MLKYCLSFAMLLIVSCSQQEAELELIFTSTNKDTITELNAFYLNELPMLPKARKESFKNVKCVAPNRFVFSSLHPGLYFGLLQIVHHGSTYNISIDSIKIDRKRNSISKEVNLGSVQLKWSCRLGMPRGPVSIDSKMRTRAPAACDNLSQRWHTWLAFMLVLP